MRRPILLGIAFVAMSSPLQADGAREMQRALEEPASAAFTIWDWSRWREPLTVLYARRDHSPLWFSYGRLTPSGAALLDELSKVERRGLIPDDYDGARLRQLVRSLAPPGVMPSQARLAGIDLAMSATAARLASDLHRGRLDPASVGYDLDVPTDSLDVTAAVHALATTTHTATTLDSFEPRLNHYALLKESLVQFLELARRSDLTHLPSPPSARLGTGAEYEGAPPLRRLLRALGDLPAGGGTADESRVLDETLVAGLRRFQTRHGLDADGVLGPHTFAALTVPLSLRAEQIALSLERIRWLPPRLESPPIIVNVPQFKLFAFRGTEDAARDILQMDVIVGETFEANRTPVFAADMRYVVLNPYWDVPHSILIKELLPQILGDAAWLDRHGYEIVRGPGDDARPIAATAENLRLLGAGVLRLRQKPGAGNALGRVKFIFPNRHNVYMHDTPAPELFSRARRAFSHGCIRLADPLRLLAHVLRDDPRWDEPRIAEALRSGLPVRIPLERPIRVFILYGTALTLEDGATLFFDDIYEQDARLTWLLDTRRRRTATHRGRIRRTAHRIGAAADRRGRRWAVP